MTGSHLDALDALRDRLHADIHVRCAKAKYAAEIECDVVWLWLDNEIRFLRRSVAARRGWITRRAASRSVHERPR